MDAAKMQRVNKVCDEIAKAVVPHGLKPDFAGFKDGKGPGFSMTISFGERDHEGNQMNLDDAPGS